jgi:formylglycine-generating enzyme required for sulfatase activity
VSWFDAVALCNAISRELRLPVAYHVGPAGVTWDRDAAGIRLPTEAEWELAARAGNEDPRYGPLDAIAWWRDNSGGVPWPVGLKAPNRLGLCDMLGNVREWVWDVYGAYPTGTTDDPIGPHRGARRVCRGGCYAAPEGQVRAAARESVSPGERRPDVGLRLARDRR